MKKIFYFASSIILLLIVSGCIGYEPIFGSKNLRFQISNYTIEGNKMLGNKIYAQLLDLSKLEKNNPNSKGIDLYINVTKNKTPVSKNTVGKIIEYQLILNAEIIMDDTLTETKLLNQTFTSSSKYKVQDQYSETVNLENQITEDLINNIYQDLLITLSTSLTL